MVQKGGELPGLVSRGPGGVGSVERARDEVQEVSGCQIKPLFGSLDFFCR